MRAACFLALAAVVAGCGGQTGDRLGESAVVAAGGAGGVSAGGSGSAAGGASAGRGGGVVGGGGVAGAGEAGGHAPSCVHTNDSFQLSFSTTDGAMHSCQTFHDPGDTELDAAVNSVAGDVITFDPCSPLADCAGPFLTFTISAPGLALAIPVGTFVHVKAQAFMPVSTFGCCSRRVMIVNLPVWDGVKNPTADGAFLWLAGSESSDGYIADMGVSVDHVTQGCYQPPMSCAGPSEAKDEWLLRFHDVAGVGSDAEVSMAGEETWTPGSRPGETWRIRDLKSFSSGICDDYCSTAWWVVRQ